MWVALFEIWKLGFFCNSSISSSPSTHSIIILNEYSFWSCSSMSCLQQVSIASRSDKTSCSDVTSLRPLVMQTKTSLLSLIIWCSRLGEAPKNRFDNVISASFLILMLLLLASFKIFPKIAFSTNYFTLSEESAVILLDAQQASCTNVGISVFISACSLSRMPWNIKLAVTCNDEEDNMLAKILDKDEWMLRLLE